MNNEVIIPNSMVPQPEMHEIIIANILSKHYKTSILFLEPSRGYKQKTPDIQMLSVLWEIKSPTGLSRHTIEVQIRSALLQSRNIIISGQRTKIPDGKIINELKKSLVHKKINKLIFISKDSLVIEIYKKK